MRVASWNVAAVNNNPFEYWLTHPDAEYTRLMQAVEESIVAPGERDVPIGQVFSDAMFAELKARMEGEGWVGVGETEALWRSDFRERRIVSGFLKDGTLGKKRLASMPDRFTNTITAADGTSVPRPSVINSFTGPMDSMGEWWKQWQAFLFETHIPIAGRDGAPTRKRPVELLSAIKRAKYPEVSEEEERISLPLQTLCLALFDAILVHLLNTLAPGTWQPLKQQLVRMLVAGKQGRTAAIVKDTHTAAQVLCLQEASAGLARLLALQLAPARFVVVPAALDPSRDQNSLCLLSAESFDPSTVSEVTDAIVGSLAGCSLAPGDLLAFTVRGKGSLAGSTYLIASFHGDTNGLQTRPVVRALAAHAANLDGAAAAGERVRLVAGLDANTYLNADGKLDPSKFYLADHFASDCSALALTNCWPQAARWAGALTTFNARTYLQPQLNKACKFKEMLSKGDRNPKVAQAALGGPALRPRARWSPAPVPGCSSPLALTPSHHARPRAGWPRPRPPAGSHHLLGGPVQRAFVCARQHGRQHVPGREGLAGTRLPV
jgi:hypothetical protein